MPIQRLAPLSRWFALAVLIATSGGCSRWNNTEQYGVFTATDYWSQNHLKWDGGNTEVYKRKLCSTVDSRCISGEHIKVGDSPGPVIEIPQWLNSESNQFNQPVLFTKANGKPISCLNCENPSAFYQLLAEQHLNWSDDGKRAFVTTGKPYLTEQTASDPKQVKQHPLWLLEFKPDGFTTTNIAPMQTISPNTTWHEISFSADGSNLAWRLCDPDCTVWHYRIADQRHTAKTTNCPHTSYWNIKWRDNQPFSEHYWSTQEKDLCYTADGKLAFPIQPSPYQQ